MQLDDRKNNLPLDAPMVKDTFQKVQDHIDEIHCNNHIDDMTKK